MVGFWNIWLNSLNFFWFQAVNILTGSLSAIARRWSFPSDVSPSQEGHHSALQSLSYLNMADYDYLHFASLWSLSNQNWKYYKNLQLRLQQSSVVFVATPLVVMAIGMKLWFKKLAMNQTSRSNQRNEMINRRVSVMLRDCFDIWNTLVSFLVRQCLLLYCQVHISLSWLPSKLCCKVLESL